MSLAQRVEKAKRLKFSHNPYDGPGRYTTWGSKDSQTYGKVYYRVSLSHCEGKVYTPDGKKDVTVLLAICQKDDGSYNVVECPDCKFNKAVCKHSLGALYNAFEADGKLISFYEGYEAALKMSFGHKVYRVQSGKGFCWAVVKPWPKREILSVEENVNLMHGSEEDEGID